MVQIGETLGITKQEMPSRKGCRTFHPLGNSYGKEGQKKDSPKTAHPAHVEQSIRTDQPAAGEA